MVVQDCVRTGLKALTEEYTQRFAPATFLERFLVETLASYEWRSRQYMRMEAAIRDHCSEAFTARAGKDLDRLHRLTDSAQREFSIALKRLIDMQAERAPVPPSSGLFVVPKR